VERAAKMKRDEYEKARDAVTDPKDLFRSNPEYSAFDETGLPTLDKAGVAIAKAQTKKLKSRQIWNHE